MTQEIRRLLYVNTKREAKKERNEHDLGMGDMLFHA
jgi:hypothetical protein